MFSVVLFLAVIGAIKPARAGRPSDGSTVGKLPAMGWNNYNQFPIHYTEETFYANAQLLKDLGLQELGYTYVNIDDAWADKRGRDMKTGALRWNETKFPNGIPYMAEKLHEMGFKFGIYSDAGHLTCGGYPASLYNELLDATTFAGWGVDYLKYDNCDICPSWPEDDYTFYPEDWFGSFQKQHGNGPSPKDYDWSTSSSFHRFDRMASALALQNRTILYSLCQWGHAHVERWGNVTGQSWRMFGDIVAKWDGFESHNPGDMETGRTWGILPILNQASFTAEYTNFYGHNDWDMLEVGNGPLTPPESRTHFALWAALKSPLFIGSDLRTITPSDLAILSNKDLIAFNQDPVWGQSALPFSWGSLPDWSYSHVQPAEYWSGPSVAGIHVFIVNTLNETSTRSIKLSMVPGLRKGQEYNVRDSWAAKSIGTEKDVMEVTLEAHDTAALLFTLPDGSHPYPHMPFPKPALYAKKPLHWPEMYGPGVGVESAAADEVGVEFWQDGEVMAVRHEEL